MKKIEDYLHLYLGCEITSSGGKKHPLTVYWLNFYKINENALPLVKLILRPLSDMSLSESHYIIENHTMRMVDMGHNRKEFAINICERFAEQGWLLLYLLKQEFDLFGLIEAGLAIDKTLINTN